MNDDHTGSVLPMILVVDDCYTSRRLVSWYLMEAGFEVGLAENGLEALEMMGRESYALVVADLNMPQMDGWELTRVIKEEPAYEGIPVIILTSQNEEEEYQRAMEAGADRFLGKPIEKRALVQEVVRLVKQATMMVEGSSPKVG